MKLLQILVLLAMLATQVSCIWDEIDQCREVKKKRRGYRAGFVDPKMLLESNKFWTGDMLARGSIESRDDLPSIELYESTSFMYRQRQRNEAKMYKVDDCAVWDDFYINVTEINREHYDFYIADPDTGEYLFKNQSYLILFGLKDDEESLYWGKLMSEKHCELNRLGIIPLFADILLDPVLSFTYDRKFTPQLFMLWNETQRAYAFDFSTKKQDSINDWALTGAFKNSSINFPVPGIMSWQAFKFYEFKEQMIGAYFQYIGNYVIKYAFKLPEKVALSAPVMYFIDIDNRDTFQTKFRTHFHGFIVLVLIVSFINLQIFRRFCCKKIIVIRKKKRVDKDK